MATSVVKGSKSPESKKVVAPEINKDVKKGTRRQKPVAPEGHRYIFMGAFMLTAVPQK